jgi:hypothetical protein
MKFNEEHTVFIAYNNKEKKEIFSKELEEYFKEFVNGEIVSAKAAFDDKY